MRQIQLLVSDDRYPTVADLLDREGIDYVRHRAWMDEREGWLVTFPLPTDAIGYVFDQLEKVGIEDDQYTVIASVETAYTPGIESLRERFAEDFDPLTTMELQSKARDMSQDMRSFLAMIFLSAIIATAGLLMESPAVVVGSMVIAPIVGPVLTTAVGITTGQTRMVLDSSWYQAAGLAVAIAGAWIFGIVLRVGGFVPSALDITSIDLIAVRIAPGALTVAIGLAAGAAAAYGLATKGPTSLIGVMIAAALIPAAATVGLAAAWGHPRIAMGSLLLVVLTLILINLAAISVLWRFGYGTGNRMATLSITRPIQVAVVIVLVVIIAITAGAAYDQTVHERDINREAESTLAAYDHIELVSVQPEYRGVGFAEPETVTIHVSMAGEAGRDEAVNDLDRRITETIDDDLTVRVRVIEYQYGQSG